MKYYEIENLYVENINCDFLIDTLNESNDILEYYGIIHDCDIKVYTGEIKKPHYHLYIAFEDYGRNTIDKVREYFKPLTSRINSVKSIKKAIQYLIHFNDKNKYQYDVNQVFTNNKDKLLKQFEEKEKEINQVLDLFIESIYNLSITSRNDIIRFFRENHKQQYLISHFNYILNVYDTIWSEGFSAKKCLMYDYDINTKQ